MSWLARIHSATAEATESRSVQHSGSGPSCEYPYRTVPLAQLFPDPPLRRRAPRRNCLSQNQLIPLKRCFWKKVGETAESLVGKVVSLPTPGLFPSARSHILPAARKPDIPILPSSRLGLHRHHRGWPSPLQRAEATCACLHLISFCSRTVCAGG